MHLEVGAVKRIITLLLILATILSLAAGLEISKKIRVVILPARSLHGWSRDDVDYLLSLLEETMLELGRFEVYSRQNLREIMKERGLQELGITEAMELGEIASARYVILLTLNELVTGYDSENKEYYAMSNLSVKVLDISDGRVVAVKTISEKSYGKTRADAKQNLFLSISSSFSLIIRNFFKIKASVARIRGDTVYLRDVDIDILRVGMIFKITGGLGREGYVKIVGEENGLAVAKVLYGYVRRGAEAIEYPMLGVGGAMMLDVYNLDIAGYLKGTTFGVSVISWPFQAPLYVDFSYLVGSVLNYTIFTLDLGGRFDFLHLGHIFLGGKAGFTMFGVYDTKNEDVLFSTFGACAGADIRYEFNPSMGIYAKYDYRVYLGASGSEFNLGLYFGF